MKVDVKKLIILNTPYVIVFYIVEDRKSVV